MFFHVVHFTCKFTLEITKCPSGCVNDIVGLDTIVILFLVQDIVGGGNPLGGLHLNSIDWPDSVRYLVAGKSNVFFMSEKGKFGISQKGILFSSET